MTKKQSIISWIIILIGIIYCLLSCTPIKRLERIQKKHPYLFEAKTDTILHHDTINIVVPSVMLDTVVHYYKLIDTVTIEKNGVSTQIWLKNDSVFVNTKTDTIYISVPYEVKIPYTRYETPTPPKKDKLKPFLFLSILLFFFLFIFKKLI